MEWWLVYILYSLFVTALVISTMWYEQDYVKNSDITLAFALSFIPVINIFTMFLAIALWISYGIKSSGILGKIPDFGFKGRKRD